MSALLALLVAVAAPRPAALKTFRDWTVGCDNGRLCQAVALLPEDDPEATTMALRRGAEPEAAPELWIDPPDAKAAAATVDGRSFPLEEAADGSMRPTDAPAFIKALLSARQLALVDRGGKRVAMLSASGASAALLYMDEQQGRIGTRTALARPGPKPAAAVPTPPPLPLVRRPALSATPARTLSKGQVRRLLGSDAATCEHANQLQVESSRLDGGHSLVLTTHPCGNGAYNFAYSAFVVDERGRARRARFDTSRGLGEQEDVLVNASWDPVNRRLGSFSKGRGVGDCGVGQEFVWDGRIFRLVREEAMGECRGSMDYITTWRAEVR